MTKAMKHARSVRSWCVAGGMVMAALNSPPVLARDLPAERAARSAVLQGGHSAAYFGIQDAVEQRASIRAVLSGVQLDRVRQSPGLAAAGTLLLLQMFAGGGGAPTDLAEARSDVGPALKSAGAEK